MHRPSRAALLTTQLARVARVTGFLTPAARAQFARTAHIDETSLPPLTILIPIFNEPVSALRRSLNGLLELDYPQERLTVRWLVGRRMSADVATVERLRAEFAGRIPARWTAIILETTAPRGRAVNDAMTHVTDAWVGLLDCDCVLDPGAARAALSVLLLGEADFVEALEYQEIQGLRTRVFTAQNVAYAASLSFMQRHLGWHFLAVSSVFFNRTLFSRVGPYPEVDVEEGHLWSVPAAKAGVRACWIRGVTWGVASSSLRRVLLQRSSWLRGQLKAARLAVQGGLPARVRIGLVVQTASLAIEGLFPLIIVLSIWSDAMRYVATAIYAVECLRAVGACRSGLAPARLGIGWLLLPLFEAIEGVMVWKALADILLRRKPRHSLRDTESLPALVREP